MCIDLINNIAITKKYYPKCKSLAKRDFMAEELHQEFLLRLCELGEDKIKEASDGGYIDWFCLDVINKIWGKRNRVKCYDKGNTSPFFEFSSSTHESIMFEDSDVFKIDYHYKEAKDILQKDINSDDKDLNYKSRVFTWSVGLSIDNNGVINEDKKYKNALQFSKDSKIPYASVYQAFKKYKQILKDKLK